MLNKEIERAIVKNPNIKVKQFVNQSGIKIRKFYRSWLEEYKPKNLFEEKRLEIVKEYLLQSFKRKITEIAEDLNFCDRYYFSKWFHKKMGVSPQQYRMMSLKERTKIEHKRHIWANRTKEIVI